MEKKKTQHTKPRCQNAKKEKKGGSRGKKEIRREKKKESTKSKMIEEETNVPPLTGQPGVPLPQTVDNPALNTGMLTGLDYRSNGLQYVNGTPVLTGIIRRSTMECQTFLTETKKTLKAPIECVEMLIKVIPLIAKTHDYMARNYALYIGLIKSQKTIIRTMFYELQCCIDQNDIDKYEKVKDETNVIQAVQELMQYRQEKAELQLDAYSSREMLQKLNEKILVTLENAEWMINIERLQMITVGQWHELHKVLCEYNSEDRHVPMVIQRRDRNMTLAMAMDHLNKIPEEGIEIRRMPTTTTCMDTIANEARVAILEYETRYMPVGVLKGTVNRIPWENPEKRDGRKRNLNRLLDLYGKGYI